MTKYTNPLRHTQTTGKQTGKTSQRKYNKHTTTHRRTPRKQNNNECYTCCRQVQYTPWQNTQQTYTPPRKHKSSHRQQKHCPETKLQRPATHTTEQQY